MRVRPFRRRVMALIREPLASADRSAPRVDRAVGLGRARKRADPNGIAAAIGRNLRDLRARRGYSLDQLATLSEVSRAMLSQIETGKSVPTIGVLWKAAAALDVTVSQLLPAQALPAFVVRRADAPVVRSRDGAAARRALHKLDAHPGVHVFEITLAEGGADAVENAAPGGRATLVAAQGAVAFAANSEPPVTLGPGDAATFACDQPHAFRNADSDVATVYLVLAPREPWSGQGASI